MAENPFIGTWRLVSWEFRGANGQVIYPFGQDAHGYIMYNQDGYMSVAIMKDGRPNYKSEDFFAVSIEEKVSALETYYSYCGKYEICGDKVIHHVETSLLPNETGKDLERFYRFDGDRLFLIACSPFPLGGIEHTSYLIWERNQRV
jgi:hypothetical protein